MDTTEICKANMVSKSHDAEVSWDDEFQQLVQTFPKDKTWAGDNMYFYQGFWCPSLVLKSVISFQNHFQAFDSDVIVATFPKCGTTWLKALTFSTLYRNKFKKDEHPLFSFGPHELVRVFEYDLYLNNPFPDLENACLYQPRLFSTHVPYASLPTSIRDSNCKLICICRNPMDMFISLWHFTDKLRDEKMDSVSLDEAFDKFCNGVCGFGPFFDHVLGYWKASQENPNKILFLKYEALKEDINSHLKKLAMFLGVPFTEEEEKEGVVEEIAKICSFNNLKELEVNKKGLHISGIPHTDFFRKAKVGDWSNYLTPAMVERMEKLVQEKLDNSGFTFKFS
ncbi:sulfotransferase 2A, ARABIDOPSIS THALIANA SULFOTRANSFERASE 2A [Hibiscus trionum]|uniref:Sulfotransferase n=1 Tax=Hibiscus trionum TaxID=183268 RepID=A0A9W7LI71_HIBTR|nr:sulfotransferase 2A, ARABIDOPSIS THALIANA SULFOTRANSFERASE 2A [Hibiscus trionum]